VTVHDELSLEADHDDSIAIRFQFRINLLLPLSFNQPICILCLHLALSKISRKKHKVEWIEL